MRASSQIGTFGYEIGYDPVEKHAGFVAESSRINNVYAFTDNNVLTVGRWSFLTAVYDNTQMSIYRDGILEDTATFTYNTGTTFPDKNMAIGTRLYDSSTEGYFTGLIDDVRIYNYALDANEVAALYAQGEAHLQGIEIAGPNSVPEESDTRYHVIGHYDDGSSKNITADANLAVVPDEFAVIDVNGLLSTDRLFRPREICTINADCEGLSASKQVVIYSVCDGNQCTERQLLKRNIADTIEIKQGITKDLNYAMKIERATMQMMPRVMIRLNPRDRVRIVQININLLAALTDELWAKRRIDQSVDSLEEAIRLLLTDSNSPPR